jgi:hypothetical protein
MAALRGRLALGILTKNEREQLAKLQDKAKRLATKLERLKADANGYKETLSYSETFTFLPTPGRRTKVLAGDSTKLAAWHRKLLRPVAIPSLPVDLFKAESKVEPLLADTTCADDSCAVGVVNGFVFRQPAPATLKVVAKANSETVIDDKVAVAQFGRLRVLPLRSRWGEKNTLSASFAMDGMPTSVEYKALKAPGVDLFKAGNQAAEGYLAIRDEIQAAKEERETAAKTAADAKSKAELDALKQEEAVLEAQAKLDALKKPPNPEIEALEADIAILKLKKEQAELKAALEQKEKP